MKPAKPLAVAKASALPDIHRLLPQSPDAEQGLLSSILLAPREVGGLCAEKGVGGCFSYPGACDDPRAAAGDVGCESADRCAHAHPGLRDRHQLDRVGGAAFVSDLFTFLPTAANAGYYLEIVEEKHTLREIIRVCTEYASRSYDERKTWRGCSIAWRRRCSPIPAAPKALDIVAEIEAEQALVAANRELITRFEQKIRATLARIWGEESLSATVLPAVLYETDSERETSFMAAEEPAVYG
jgi:hypothetical protein